MVTAVIVAAGRGVRMGPNVDKLFMEIEEAPLIAYTWMRFEESNAVDHIVFVTRPENFDVFDDLRARYGFTKPHTVVEGGAERQDSVWNGIQVSPEGTEILLIHDAARPAVAESAINDTIQAARRHGAAVVCSRVTDTMKRIGADAMIADHLDRQFLRAVQTPQVFRAEILRRAIRAAQDSGLTLTDDTAACELIGQPVALVDSDEPNPKATTPADLPLLRQLLMSTASALRTRRAHPI